ncbi:DUF7835 family putative zinc beta-ribbon protein [Halomarina pelagica]|uniref:DUF7835 family putative zinc beta-ribbon protein n=1 Tax=Halomarina pelagica TaxID=2961599 RepID=UPI0020C592D3|nr:hypothetical protein [Halomarina sp. BND7]
MAATRNQSNDMLEGCADCGRETPHSVRLEIRTESQKSENAQFSREPYRVSTCRICGAETALRMNNA